MADKRHVAISLKIISYGGPFQAEIVFENGMEWLVHYKHGVLSIYLTRWSDNAILRIPLNVELGTLADGSLTEQELRDLLGGLVRWQDKENAEHKVVVGLDLAVGRDRTEVVFHDIGKEINTAREQDEVSQLWLYISKNR